MGVYIIRNGQKFGPYDTAMLKTYVDNGQILLCDEAEEYGIDTKTTTVKAIMKRNGLTPKIASAGNIFEQIKSIGRELIVPHQALRSRRWLKDNSLLLLTLVGLGPSILMFVPLPDGAVFYLVALYFSTIWALFFYYIFKTPQVTVKTTISVFFGIQLVTFVFWDLLGLPNFNPFYSFLSFPFPLDVLGYVFGVGLTEEFVKAIPLFYITAKADKPMVPQTVVYYGLLSGIGFGVYEGVEYQMQVNIALDYTSAFFLNIARLTCLPFIHAIWCGIAGYFIAFAKLYPRYRHSLYVLAIAIPMTLHGLYDTFCSCTLGFIIALPVMLLSVLLLMTYLKQGSLYQNKLRQ